eukprot:1078752-Rhodomonas_salina.2
MSEGKDRTVDGLQFGALALPIYCRNGRCVFLGSCVGFAFQLMKSAETNENAAAGGTAVANRTSPNVLVPCAGSRPFALAP